MLEPPGVQSPPDLQSPPGVQSPGVQSPSDVQSLPDVQSPPWLRRTGLAGGAAAALMLMLIPTPEGLSATGQAVLATAAVREGFLNHRRLGICPRKLQIKYCA